MAVLAGSVEQEGYTEMVLTGNAMVDATMWTAEAVGSKLAMRLVLRRQPRTPPTSPLSNADAAYFTAVIAAIDTRT